jgi:outer membrane protein assembly factor BamB
MPTAPFSTSLTTTVGVVPIFVNAGAAVLPTLIAGFTSVIAILFKPRELLALFRRKPWLPVAILLLIAATVALLLIPSTPTRAASTNHSSGTVSTPKTDWTALALRLLEDERNAHKTTGVKPLWDYSPDPTANTLWTLSGPAFDPKSHRVFATATIQDVASLFGVLFAVDADSGRELWKIDKAGDDDLKPFFSSPALTPDGKYLVVGQGLHEDRDCALLCFDTGTQALKWSVKTPLHIESSPAIHGDLAVVGAGAIEGGPDHKPTSHPGYVFAVQISTGKQLWRHDLADPESSPAIADDGIAYIGSGFNGNAVAALRTEPDDVLKSNKQSRQLWLTKAPYPITGPVTLDGDLLLVGGGNSDFVNVDPNPAGVVLALDRHTGAVKWQTPTDDAVLARIVVANGRAYCPVRNGQILALDLATGKILWKRPAYGKSPLKAGLALSPDASTLFAATADGHLALLSAADGHPLESHDLNNPAKPGDKGLTLSTPTLADHKLFVGSETAGLRAFQSVSPK